MNRWIKTILKWVLTILIAGISIYLSLKDIDFSQLWVVLKKVKYEWALTTIPIQLLSHYIRAIRWRTILKPLMNPKSTLNLFSAVMVGYFFNNLLPRGGEFIRPYVYSRREKVSYSSVFATIIVERIIDLLTLVLLFALAFYITRDKIINAFPDDIDPNKLIYFSIFLIMLMALSFWRRFVLFALKYLIKPFSEKIYERVLELYDKFRQGFEIIKKPSSYFRITLESLSIWLCYALPMYITFFCFDFHHAIDVQLGDALLLVIVSGIGVTIAPSPNGIGIYHYVVIVAMMNLYGLDKVNALAYATINHALNTFVQLFVGGIFFIRERKNTFPSSDLLNKNIANDNISPLKSS